MPEHLHFIGIGGIGMSGIAKLAAGCGLIVSGSDLKRTKITDELENLGVRIYLGHAEDNISGADTVVYSSAIKKDNPEFLGAIKNNIPLIKRAEALARLMRDKSVITVTGSHGKTTTTSLIYCILLESGLSPTAAVGGILHNIGTNACIGTGEFFVAAADESDGSFLYYRPKYSVITNIDREHLDYYKDFEKEKSAFGEFLKLTREDGCIFACYDDANLREMLKTTAIRRVFFGLDDQSDIYPQDVWLDGLTCEFNCYYKGKLLERFSLPLGGMHNISNSLAAIAVGLELGIALPVIKRALAGFKGTGRRIEVKFRSNDYIIIDDYAHHPTEIKATLAAVKNLKPHNRLIAVFQPHRYSRTQLLLEDFARSFDLADYLIITDIYAASETPIPGVEGRSIYEKIKKYAPDKELYFLRKEEILPHLLKNIRSGDIVATLGAGDIIKVCDELVGRLKS
ncbi:MAG: UDP-N-acetylmuramate--L-alanine ligase [Candidatus Omnitrophica bacterium]|nr:UDP-N-acetylmuramate--L-alanine ligase [Candidatus Omnitrophota bacterium]